MSLIIQTDINCDVQGKKCVWWVYGGPAGSTAKVREARRYAKRDGWIRRYNKMLNRWEDVCPKCQKAVEDTNEAKENK